jgi:predicted SAM-dependent methyltransferase
MSETAKYRSLTVEHCSFYGIDIGSGGDPVVPWAIQVDLPLNEFIKYNGKSPDNFVHLGCDCQNLPFKDSTLDFVYSSHVLEDFWPWHSILFEWKRVLKPGGKIIIILPDKELWKKALEAGQPPNCAHQHEGTPGELSQYFHNWKIIRDSRTNLFPGDYSILFIAQKPL